MGRFLIAGLAVLIIGVVALVGYTANSQAQTSSPTDTPAPSATDTPAPTATVTAAGSATATSSVAATTAGTATATPRVQPAAVPVTGGNPSDGSASLILILVIALGAVGGTAGVLAASYGLTRRS